MRVSSPIQLLTLAAALAFPFPTFGQSTSIKLPTATNTSDFTVTDTNGVTLMKLFGDGGFALFGDINAALIPATGIGGRMMWFPSRKAFRAGYVNGTQWDDGNIGYASFATGFSTTGFGVASLAVGNASSALGDYSVATGVASSASGMYSIAMGNTSVASGLSSVSLGDANTASGIYAVALGHGSLASGDYSTAMGYASRATNYNSIAIGVSDTSSGNSSVAIGSGSKASGDYSFAIGDHTTSDGPHSAAMGTNVSTNNMEGSFIIGDNSTPVTTISSATNQMTLRFSGGFRLFTNPFVNGGVLLAALGNSWSTISDSTKKTNLQIADGEHFLYGLSHLKLGSWNYKDQEVKSYRHYGPMAQEIFHYYGRDAYGTIGNDTTLATADMDGIMMICLQALEKRTSDLSKAKATISRLEAQVLELQEKVAAQQSAQRIVRDEMDQMKAVFRSLTGSHAQVSSSTVSANSTEKGNHP